MATIWDILRTRPWTDITGPIIPSDGRTSSPELLAFNGGQIKDYAFASADYVDNITFHIDHGVIKGTDIYIHPHWGHNGSNIASNFVIDWYLRYMPRDGDSVGEINITQTIACDIASHPKHHCNVNDIKIANEGGTGGLFDRSIFEVDGLLQVALHVTTAPTITVSSPGTNKVFIFTADLHIQSTGIGSELKDTPYNN